MKTPPIDAIAESLTTDRLSRRTALGRLGRGGAAAAAITAVGGGAHRVAADDLVVEHGAGETGSTGTGQATDVVVRSSPHDDLPEVAAESTGRLRRLSDYDRGLWLETEDQWVSLRGEVFDVRAYGAVGDGATDDWDAFSTAIEAMTSRLDADSTSAYGRTLTVPPGTYRLAQTLVVDRAIRLVGTSGAGHGSDSILRFDEGVVGVLVAPADPDLTGQPGRRGDGAIIERLRIVSGPAPVDDGASGTESAKSAPVAVDPASIHGVWLRTGAIVRDVCVERFSGDGIRVEIAPAVSESGGPSATSGPSWEVSSTWVASCGGSGLGVRGGGGGVAELVTVTGSGRWGIEDEGAGAAYVRCHAVDNEAGSFASSGSGNRSLFAGCVAAAGQPRAVFAAGTVVVAGAYADGFQGGNAWTADASRMLLQAQSPGAGETPLPTVPTLHLRPGRGQTQPHLLIGGRPGGRLVEVDAAGRLLVGPAALTPTPTTGGDQVGAQSVQVQISAEESGEAALRWVVAGEDAAWVAQARAYREAGGTDANPDAAGGSRLTFQTAGATGQELDTLTLRDGRIGVGTTAPAPTAVLDLTSSVQGFLPPRMTSEQRDAIAGPPEGLTIFNSSTKRLNVHDGEQWREVAFTEPATEPAVGG